MANIDFMVYTQGQNSISYRAISGGEGGYIFQPIYFWDSRTMCGIFGALHNI